MVGHVLVTCPVRWPFFFCAIAHRYCAVEVVFCSLPELSGVRPPRFVRACACCPFPTSMPTLPGQQARSHPPHFASTASLPTHSPPQSSKMRRVVPTSPPFVLAVAHSSTTV